MAVTSDTKNGTKQVFSNSQSVKPVLASPFTTSWPEISQDIMLKVKDELVKCTHGMKKTHISPKWKELIKLTKAQRLEKKNELLTAHLNTLSLEEREKFDASESEKISKWKHLVHGYNNVMRLTEKNELACIFVKKNVTPQVLGLGFVPICFAKNIPLVAIDDLDSILKCDESLGVTHSIIVLGLKKSILDSADCPFKNLHTLMVEAWDSKLTVEDSVLSETIEVIKPNSVGGSTSARRKKREPPPKIDVRKYLLIRNSSSERVFMNDSEDTSGFFSLGQYSNKVKSFNIKEENKISSSEQVKIKSDPETTSSEQVKIKSDPETTSSDINFDFNSDFLFLDTAAEDDPSSHQSQVNKKKRKPQNNKIKGLKRKLSSNYIPAAVVKMKSNIHKKKKKN